MLLDYSKLTLETLLENYRKADTKAFEEFFRRTRKLVYNFIAFKVGNRVEADDIMQETYFRIHRYVSGFDSEKGALGWAMAIARNAIFDHFRVKKKLSINESFDEQDFFSEAANSEQLSMWRQEIDLSFSGLSADERELILERALNGASYDEIAVETGYTVQNVRQKVSRLLKRMRA